MRRFKACRDAVQAAEAPKDWNKDDMAYRKSPAEQAAAAQAAQVHGSFPQAGPERKRRKNMRAPSKAMVSKKLGAHKT